MNGLIEQVVKKEKSPRYYINVLLIILGALAVPSILIAFAFITGPAYLAYLAIFAFLFMIYFAWLMISSLKVDYEYAFISSSLNISKIIAKRKRKIIVKVDVKSFDDFFRYDDKTMGEKKFTKIYRAAGNEFSPENYVASFHSEAKGRCAIIFTPNDELIDAMKPYFNNELRKKMFKENRL